MSDIMKTMAGGWSFVVSWVFPALIAWSTFWFFVAPSLQSFEVVRLVLATEPTTQLAALLGASFMTAILLSSMSTVLFRVLEGYLLVPHRLKERLIGRQQRGRQKLSDELAAMKATRVSSEGSDLGTPNVAGSGLQIGLVREKLRRYPVDTRQLGPTGFSNALRAIETYGWDRYRLDSQTLWSELRSAVPEGLADEQERARAPINFFVSLVFLSLAESVACAVAILKVQQFEAVLVGVAVVSLISVAGWYRLAISSTRYLAAVMQATVNVGRPALARMLGLRLPTTLAEERDMWERLFWLVDDPFNPEYQTDLDRYRNLPQSDSDG